MLQLFLTSSPTGPLDGSRQVDGIDKWNGFKEELMAVWPSQARCLMVASDPFNYGVMDEMTGYFWHTWLREGFSMTCMDKLDYRWGEPGGITREQLQAYDVLFLAGGHVPTQIGYFQNIHLREKLAGFEGVVIGISAGSMDSADWVYIQPEEPGESRADFCRWGQGLNMTQRNIMPHYQQVKDNYLDGKRLYADIILPDSLGHEFICLCDGSYIHQVSECAGGRVLSEVLRGEAYLARDGVTEPFNGHEQEKQLS